MGRLGNLTVLIIGISISVIILSWSYFWHFQGDYDMAAAQTALARNLHDNASDIQKAENRKEEAQNKVAKMFDQWRSIVVNHAPPTRLDLGGMDMAVNGYYMPIAAHDFRNNLQLAVNKQLIVGGVKVINGPTIPDPGESGPDIVANFFNYPAIPFPIVIFDLGQITVQGTYSQIKANVLGWASMPNYFAVSDGLALNGTSPILTGTYSVSMIGYIRGKTIYPGLPVAAAEVAAVKPVGAKPVAKPAARPAPAKAPANQGAGPSPSRLGRPAPGARQPVQRPGAPAVGRPAPTGRPGAPAPGTGAPAGRPAAPAGRPGAPAAGAPAARHGAPSGGGN